MTAKQALIRGHLFVTVQRSTNQLRARLRRSRKIGALVRCICLLGSIAGRVAIHERGGVPVVPQG